MTRTTRTSAGTAVELMATAAALRRVTRRRLRALGGGLGTASALRGTQLELLQLVEAEPGIGVAAAARALHLAGNSVSTMVNQLVAAGLLQREVDPADRRAARLWLTETAHTRLTGWRTARGELVGAALERLTEADRASVSAALPALRRLLAQLEDMP
ncbi:MAG TPA: MarR family winged helix-turn-helix transcriptional regulator [Pseudonocardia sp.]